MGTIPPVTTVTETTQGRSLPPLPQRRALLAGLGLIAFHLCQMLSGSADGLWLPSLGLGIALTAWVGYRMVILLAMDAIVANVTGGHERPIPIHCLDALLSAG